MAIEFEKKSLAHPEGDAIKRRGFSFFVAAFCLIACFVTAATAIPMMAYWVSELQLSSSEVAMSVVTSPAAFSRLSFLPVFLIF